MKIKNPQLMGLVFLILSRGLMAESVQWVKMIDLKSENKKKNLGSWILGSQKPKEIKPYSLGEINEKLLCVTDAVNGLVVILEKNGKIIKRMNRLKHGRLVSPVSQCLDNKGNLYISDSALRQILQFDNRFEFKKVFIEDAKSRITGIFFSQGFFYCADTQNHRILVYNLNGTLELSFGKRGDNPGEFNFPTHICVNQDQIYVTDALNFRVQIFTCQGKFVSSLGTAGRGGGNLSKPKGLTVDQEQRIYITDVMFDNVQIFNREGQFLTFFGAPGHQAGEFWMPSAVWVDHENLIWVADTYNSRLQIFRIEKGSK